MAATPANALNITASGLVNFDGTATFTGVTVTNHNVLIGGSSNSITSVAPSATSGVPLISNGSSADPGFGTAVVAGGGTGVASFNTNGAVISNTSSTGALSAVSLTDGQLLIGSSTGAPAAATITAGSGISVTNGHNTITVAASASSPNANPSLYEDFIGYSSNAATYVWTFGGLSQQMTAVAKGSGDNGHPGMLSNQTSSVGCHLGLGASDGTSGILLGGGSLTINWVIKITTLSNSSNRYTLRVGLGDTSQAAQANGVYFQYADNVNSGNWQYLASQASTVTTSSSSTAVTTGWHNLQIVVNGAASSVSYSVDGVSLGTAISTNIPTANSIVPFFDFVASAGTIASNSLQVDLMSMSQTLTSAR